MRAMAEHRGTITFAPTFAFALAARRAPTGPNALELGHVRVVGCGAEPVRADTLRQFAQAFAPSGLPPGALLPCYGLAEATLAVAFSPVDRGVVELDGVTSCGPPLAGVEVRVVGPAGESLAAGAVGEIHVRGSSTARGYLADPEATAEAFGADGWLRTGDLGRLVDGELLVTGRRKDVVIVHGRNLPAQQVEWLVERVPGVRAGAVAAFGVAGAAAEELVVVVEVSGSADRAAVAEAVRAIVAAELQVVPADVVCVAPRQLPRTTSGKLRRFAIRESWAAGTLTAGRR
jgi:fatty-acyl-CoA synthase